MLMDKVHTFSCPGKGRNTGKEQQPPWVVSASLRARNSRRSVKVGGFVRGEGPRRRSTDDRALGAKSCPKHWTQERARDLVIDKTV